MDVDQIQKDSSVRLDLSDKKENLSYDSLCNQIEEEKVANYQNFDFSGIKFDSVPNRKYPRSCKYCLILKPNRTHHCRNCKMCVRVLDHHCYFINNCIGIDNYKFFLLFIYYSLIILLFTSFSMFSGLNFIYLEFGIDSLEFLFMSSIQISNFIISLCMGYLLYFHLYLIYKGLTTIEYIEKFKKNPEKIENYINSREYNKNSAITNFKKILGNNILLWFFPFVESKIFDGYQ